MRGINHGARACMHTKSDEDEDTEEETRDIGAQVTTDTASRV